MRSSPLCLLGFGSTMVDNVKVPVQAYPALLVVAGFLANALGLEHAQVKEIQDLQTQLQYAVREDVGDIIQDYQTVDLGLPGQSENGMDDPRLSRKRLGGLTLRRVPISVKGLM